MDRESNITLGDVGNRREINKKFANYSIPLSSPQDYNDRRPETVRETGAATTSLFVTVVASLWNLAMELLNIARFF